MHHHERLFIDGPVGKLQAIYHAGHNDRPAVVICHPHPQFGGTMRNKVVYWMGQAFEDLGHPVLRFNFRGVEQSEGVWDAGDGESEDAGAALDWMRDRHPMVPLWLAGFSFGSFAGLKAAVDDERIERMFAVAPAVNLWDFSFMRNESRPLRVIHGTEDELVPYPTVAAWVELIDRAEFMTIDGADHFFARHGDAFKASLVSGL